MVPFTCSATALASSKTTVMGHADGHQERTEGSLVSSVGEGEAHDGTEFDPAVLEVCLGIPEDRGSGGCDGVAVDGADLVQVWLRCGTA
jgi:hypothetical protein